MPTQVAPGAAGLATQMSVLVHAFRSLHARPTRRVQTPSAVAPSFTVQASQSFLLLPPQAVLQQTPSAQDFDLQSLFSSQALPLSRRPHLPPKHLVPAMHCASLVQVFSQAVPPPLHTMMGLQTSVA